MIYLFVQSKNKYYSVNYACASSFNLKKEKPGSFQMIAGHKTQGVKYLAISGKYNQPGGCILFYNGK
jgi:hypothetical protein